MIMTNPILLYSGSHIRVWWYRSGNRNVILTFDHWKANRMEFEAIDRSSYCTRRGFDHVYFQCSRNDWYCNKDWLNAIESAKDAVSEYSSSRCVGFSMGGVPALVSAMHLGATSAVAISPRLPYALRSKISLMAPPEYHSDWTIVYDPIIDRDRIAANSLMDRSANTTAVKLIGGGHPATGRMARYGLKGHALNAILGSENIEGDLTELHAAATYTQTSIAA